MKYEEGSDTVWTNIYQCMDLEIYSLKEMDRNGPVHFSE